MSSIGLMVMTDGRANCLERTLESLDQVVAFPRGELFRVVINDCPDPAYGEWLAGLGFDLIVPPLRRKRGFGGAIQAGWDTMRAAGVEWVFHLEDDFQFQRHVDVGAMRRVLQEQTHLVQMALKRQPWNEAEKEAGGIVELNPDAFTEATDGFHQWVEHRLFFTTNPSLYHSDLMELGWPDGEFSEGKFTQRVLAGQGSFGYWGRKWDPPWVLHIGDERVGTGY